MWNNVSMNKTKSPALFALHSREGERQIINNKDNYDNSRISSLNGCWGVYYGRKSYKNIWKKRIEI